jgi:hypothetical protein
LTGRATPPKELSTAAARSPDESHSGGADQGFQMAPPFACDPMPAGRTGVDMHMALVPLQIEGCRARKVDSGPRKVDSGAQTVLSRARAPDYDGSMRRGNAVERSEPTRPDMLAKVVEEKSALVQGNQKFRKCSNPK